MGGNGDGGEDGAGDETTGSGGAELHVKVIETEKEVEATGGINCSSFPIILQNWLQWGRRLSNDSERNDAVVVTKSGGEEEIVGKGEEMMHDIECRTVYLIRIYIYTMIFSIYTMIL